MIDEQPPDNSILERVGKFSVARCYTIVPERVKQLVDIFGKLEFLPLRIQFDPFLDAYWYSGYSKEFKPIHEGAIIPEYTIIAETALGEVISVQAEQRVGEGIFIKGPIFGAEGDAANPS